MLALLLAPAGAAADEPPSPTPAEPVAPATPAPSAPAAPEPAPVAPRIDETWVTRITSEALPSVARIQVGDGFGAGFLFYSSSHVATAWHVVSDGGKITVQFPDGQRRRAELAAASPANDLAILELDKPVEGLLVLEPDPSPITVGAPVIAIGHPFSSAGKGKLKGLLNWTVTAGILSAYSTRFLQTDAVVNPGNSGGPVLSADGRVLGVVTERGPPGLGFAVRVDHLVALIDEIGQPKDLRRSFGFRRRLGVVFGMDAARGSGGPWFLGAQVRVGVAVTTWFVVEIGLTQAWADVAGGSLEATTTDAALVVRLSSQFFSSAYGASLFGVTAEKISVSAGDTSEDAFALGGFVGMVRDWFQIRLGSSYDFHDEVERFHMSLLIQI